MGHLTEGLTYDYITVENPPTREERIGSCSSYCGSCSGLLHGIKSGCANMATRKFAQSGGCQLMLAVGIVSSLTNVVMIMHAPLGCCSSFVGTNGLRKSMRASKGKVDEEFIWLHTNLDEIDVVSGGIDKLRKAVLYAEEEFHPSAIIIANSCVPGIIGDDVDSLVPELEDVVSAKIIPVHCEGFKSKYVASGYDSAYHGLLRYLIPNKKKEEVTDPARLFEISKTVNIFNVGSNSNGDEVELARIVRKLGLIPRVLPLHSTTNEIEHIGEAALNVSICATHDDYLLGHLKEIYGTEYILDTLPIGIRNTNRWVRLIANHFSLEDKAEEVIKEENEELEVGLFPLREILQGKTVFVGGGETRVLTTGEFFESMGMTLLGVKSHNADRFATFLLEDAKDNGMTVDVAAGQPAEELNLLSKLKPDLYIGHTGANGWVTKLGIPNLPLFGQSFNYMGYTGSYELAKKAVKVLSNTNLSRNVARNTKLPLSRSWNEKHPTENIKEGELY